MNCDTCPVRTRNLRHRAAPALLHAMVWLIVGLSIAFGVLVTLIVISVTI